LDHVGQHHIVVVHNTAANHSMNEVSMLASRRKLTLCTVDLRSGDGIEAFRRSIDRMLRELDDLPPPHRLQDAVDHSPICCAVT